MPKRSKKPQDSENAAQSAFLFLERVTDLAGSEPKKKAAGKKLSKERARAKTVKSRS